jgi:hypothetical protein
MKRKTNNMKYRAITIAIVIYLIPIVGIGQNFIKTKNIIKTFAAQSNANIQITNKYGDIHIVPWEKDSISFKIDVMVSYKKETDAERMINSIDFVFNINPGYLVAYTQFKNSKSDLMSDLGDLASSIFNSGNMVEINYLIYLPATTTLRVENKYGNVYMSDHSGSFSGILSNGDFRANNLTGDTKLDLSFENAIISSIPKAKIISSYSEIEITKLTSAFIESKSCKITVNESDKLDINSRRDKIYIDTLNTLNLVSDFSYINIYDLEKEATAQTTFGDLNINKISKDFSYFNLTSNYTDIVLGMDKNAAFNADISVKKTTTIFPPIISALQYLVVNQNEYKLYGNVNTSSQNISGFTLSTNSGTLTIGLK